MGAFRKKLPNYWRYALQILALFFFLTTMPSSVQAANGTVATVPPTSSWIHWCGNYCESPIYSSAAEACAAFNYNTTTYTVSNEPHTELGYTYPNSFNCLATNSTGTGFSGWVMSKGDWSCPANSTGTTSCTCNTNYVPDATGTSCVQCTPPSVFDKATGKCGPPPPPSCTAIDPIPALPTDDKDYACTQSLDKGAGNDVDKVCPPLNAKLTAWNGEMQCFAKKLASLHPPIPYDGPSATIRTKEYQKHLLEIWKKSIAIKKLTDADKLACAARIADVNAQMGSHKIKYEPSSKGGAAPHVQGIAFDIPEDVVKSLVERVTMTQVRASIAISHPGCISCMHIPMITGDVQDYINSSAINPPACKLDWGGRLFVNPVTKKADTVHFQLKPQLP